MLSQNFLLERCTKLWVVHGTLARSRFATILPRFVLMVIVAVPVFGADAGGRPTSFTLPPPVSGVQVQATVPAGRLDGAVLFLSSFSEVTIQAAAPAMTTTAIAEPMMA